MPASMPVHWLYQFFPEARKVDLGRTLDPQALFVTLLERGFRVKTRRRTYDQALSLDTSSFLAIPSLMRTHPGSVSVWLLPVDVKNLR